MKQLNYTVFPSEELTIKVQDDPIYGGAHLYEVNNCRGFIDGKTEYVESVQPLQFIEKLDDGTVVPGIQSEQLAFILYDRCRKLNERFPSPFNIKMLAGLEIFLSACQERIEDRMGRNVMGELKK